MAFTPGPWELTRTVKTHNSPNRFWETSVTSSAGYVALGQGATHEESDANARLIASAPDLLEALHECAELLDDYSDVNDGPEGEPRPNKAMSLLQRVEAAIAKAEGK